MRLTVIMFCFFSIALVGQDIHFSQFYYDVLGINPALVGHYDGQYRFSANQRTQWRSVTSPYNTFKLGAEANGIIPVNELDGGISIMKDRAGDSRLTTLAFEIALAYQLYVGDSTAVLRAGTQIGLISRKIDFDQLQFDNQYNGQAYDPAFANGENFNRNSLSRGDLNFGLAYEKIFDDEKKLTVGFSTFHLNQANVAFSESETSALDTRLNIHASGEYPVNETLKILPAGRFMVQGKFTETLLGARVRKIVEERYGMDRAWYLGGFGRFKDGLMLTVGLDYDQWTLGASYDFNLSPLRIASDRRGGFEFAVIHHLSIFNEKRVQHKFCPDFL